MIEDLLSPTSGSKSATEAPVTLAVHARTLSFGPFGDRDKEVVAKSPPEVRFRDPSANEEITEEL